MASKQMAKTEQAPASLPTLATETIEKLVVEGDLSKLSSAERLEYYTSLCNSLSLNAVSRPFEYIRLQGKLTLYARKDCAEQLRKINGVSLEIMDKRQSNDLFVVHVKATDKFNRTDEDLGVVPVGGLKGEAYANAILKAVTKAKRRVTLSICGLGFLDETEVETIPGAVVGEPVEKPAAEKPSVVEPNEPLITPNQKNMLEAIMTDTGLDREYVREWFALHMDGEVRHFNEMPRDLVGQLLDNEGDRLKTAAMIEQTIKQHDADREAVIAWMGKASKGKCKHFLDLDEARASKLIDKIVATKEEVNA